MEPVKRLPDAELEVMKALWDAGEPLTSAELEARLHRKGWASTTLLTLIARLERKGCISRTRQGRGYLYAPALSRRDYAAVESRAALGRMFGGSARNLLAALADTDALTDGDIAELSAYLDELRASHAKAQGESAK